MLILHKIIDYADQVNAAMWGKYTEPVILSEAFRKSRRICPLAAVFAANAEILRLAPLAQNDMLVTSCVLPIRLF